MLKSKKILKLVGTAYNYESLEEAFVRAGYRTWRICEYAAGASNPFSIKKPFLESYESREVSIRPFFNKRITSKLSPEFRAAAESYGQNITSDNVMELGESFAEELNRVFQPMVDGIQAKLKSTYIWPWDHIKYKIDRVRLPERSEAGYRGPCPDVHVVDNVIRRIHIR
ncbi:MAG: hypothetical protein DI586_02915 [Micavibrio aeruginosavorus]|uniref:Uncharacterized protein n=1 Tax=Micavibrio aeruginosavorus TaxID=349221 RepID=A0A2W5FNY4_9BACT|nr:MAG: hypothetical protein DI586_02915 [Micavibrio aeruginosavorus]